MLKEVVLIVTVLMPQSVPDIKHAQPMPNLEECWKGASEFVNHDLSNEMRAKGARGFGATCVAIEKPSTEN